MARLSTVIKASDVTRASEQMERLGTRSFQINDVLLEAKQAVVATEQQAAVLIADARRQAESIRQQAQKEGYRAGFEQGKTAGQKVGRDEAFETARKEFADQQQLLIASYQQAIDQIDADRADWLASGHQDLIDLAMAIAERVTHCVGKRERQVVQANLEEAIQLVGKRSEVMLQVSPMDGETARTFARELVDRREGWQHVHVVEVDEIAAGGCRIIWDSGSVDGTLDTQLARIADQLGAYDASQRDPNGMDEHRADDPS